MPASYVHICSASNAVLKWAPENEKLHLNAVQAGSEGPDPLFYSFIPKKGGTNLPAVANAMHKTKTGAFLKSLVGNAGTSTLLKSFVYGFLSHYATDTVMHPYIYTKSFEENGDYNGNKHCKYEHAMEVYVYRRSGNMRGLPVQLAGFAMLKPAEKAQIAAFLEKCIGEVYPELAPTKEEIKKSFNDAVFFSKLLRNQALSKFPVLMNIALKTKIADTADSHAMPNIPITAFDGAYSVSGFSWDDMTNAGKKEWHSIWEPEVTRTESFDELYGKAVKRSIELMTAAKDYFDGRLELAGFMDICGDNSYDSGISWEKTVVPKNLKEPEA